MRGNKDYLLKIEKRSWPKAISNYGFIKRYYSANKSWIPFIAKA